MIKVFFSSFVAVVGCGNEFSIHLLAICYLLADGEHIIE